MTRPIPDLLLERYMLDELPSATAAAIARDIAGHPALGARLEALVRSDAEIRARYAPARFVRHDAPSRQTRGLVLAGAFAAAVLGILIVMPRLPVSDGTRIKGAVDAGPSLAVYRRIPSGSERLADGAVVRPGDLLRIGYAAAGRTYGLILSIDGRGAVTQHLPPAGDRAAPLSQAEVTLLDTAYELDDAPQIERFYLIASPRPFSVAPVLTAARNAHGAPKALPLPPGLEQVTFAVQKEVRK